MLFYTSNSGNNSLNICEIITIFNYIRSNEKLITFALLYYNSCKVTSFLIRNFPLIYYNTHLQFCVTLFCNSYKVSTHTLETSYSLLARKVIYGGR